MRRRLVFPAPFAPAILSSSPPRSVKASPANSVRSPRVHLRSTASSEAAVAVWLIQGSLCGREFRSDFREQAFSLASPHPRDVVLVLQQRAQGIVDGLGVERHLVQGDERS